MATDLGWTLLVFGTMLLFPRPAEYGYAVLMFIVPFAVWGGARRVRRATERVGRGHGEAQRTPRRDDAG
jgi:hypothetical protein